jgi:hypothetical protein
MPAQAGIQYTQAMAVATLDRPLGRAMTQNMLREIIRLCG